MDIEEAKKKITEYLQGQPVVLFAYLFGSAVEHDRYRDIDVGIYMSEGVDLLKLGGMQSDLDGMFEQAIDLVPINALPRKKPVLAFNIVTSGMLLFTRDEALHTEYKKKAMLHYYDTAPLRKMMNEAFDKRVRAGKFGKRNFLLEDQ